MNKRGLGYVDWAISMGLFIIVVLAIFIFLKPGAKPVYDNENLLDLVDNNFISSNKWQIIDVPVFVKRMDKQTTEQNPRPLEAELTYSHNFTADIIEPAINPLEITHASAAVPRKITIKCRDPNLQSCANIKLNLILKPQSRQYPDPDIGITCIPIGGQFCRIEAGASEFLEGLKESITSSQDYTSLKEEWNFPESKEFVVYVNNRQVTSSPPQPSVTNVFTRTKKYWILKDNGEREPVEINMRVW